MTIFDIDKIKINLLSLIGNVKINISFYIILMMCSFIWTSKLVYLVYIILFVTWLENNGSLQDNIYKCNVTKWLYDNNIVTNLKIINYINLMVIYTYILPFTYVGLKIGYIFATLFLNITLLSFFHKKYLINI
jgi:hypothetical protein